MLAAHSNMTLQKRHDPLDKEIRAQTVLIGDERKAKLRKAAKVARRGLAGGRLSGVVCSRMPKTPSSCLRESPVRSLALRLSSRRRWPQRTGLKGGSQR